MTTNTSTSEDYVLKAITREEAARKLCATPRQVARWTQQGRLGSVRLGNRVMHTDEQIKAFVQSCTREAVKAS